MAADYQQTKQKALNKFTNPAIDMCQKDNSSMLFVHRGPGILCLSFFPN